MLRARRTHFIKSVLAFAFQRRSRINLMAGGDQVKALVAGTFREV
jgi:hypothetical protein